MRPSPAANSRPRPSPFIPSSTAERGEGERCQPRGEGKKASRPLLKKGGGRFAAQGEGCPATPPVGTGSYFVAHRAGCSIPPPAGGRAALFGAADSAAETAFLGSRSSMPAAGAALIDQSFSLEEAEKQALWTFYSPAAEGDGTPVSGGKHPSAPLSPFPPSAAERGEGERCQPRGEGKKARAACPVKKGGGRFAAQGEGCPVMPPVGTGSPLLPAGRAVPSPHQREGGQPSSARWPAPKSPLFWGVAPACPLPGQPSLTRVSS